MNIFQISILLAFVANVILGCLVYFTNPSRGANRAYLITACTFVLWLSSLAIGSTIRDEKVMFWMQQAAFLSAILPLTFDLLRVSSAHSLYSRKKVVRELMPWFIVLPLVFILCQTKYYVVGVSYTESGFAQPNYGPAQIVYIFYWILALWLLISRFIKDLKRTTGVAREEIQFVLLATVVAIVAGLAFAHIVPVLTGNKRISQLVPLSIIVLDGIMAYGIVTKRIMSAGDVLKKLAAHALLAIYLTIIYVISFYIINKTLTPCIDGARSLSHLIATLIIAFSMLPATGWMQKVAHKLFVDVREINEKEALQRANDAATSLGTIDELITGFSSILSDITGAEHVFVFFVVDNKFLQVFPECKDTKDNHLSLHNPLAEMLNDSLVPISIDQLHRMRSTEKGDMVIKVFQDFESSLSIGIRAKGVLEGMIFFSERFSGKIYSAPEQDTLQIVCNEFGMALDNARLYTDVQNSKIYNEVLLDSLVGGVVAVDTNGIVNVFNKQAQDIIGMLPEEIINRDISALPEPLSKALKDTLNNEQVLQDEDVVLVRTSGENISARISATTFHGHMQNHAGALLVINDITHLRSLEESVRRTDRLSSLGTLSAGIAHEIKNPLVAIKTFTQLLPEKYQDKEFRDTFFNLIGKEVSRIDKLVNRLLDFARPAKPSMSFISLHGVVNECLQLSGEQMRTRGVELILDLKVSNDIIVGDADLLKQVFVNFILNAIQCMEDGGELTVTTKYVKLEHRYAYNGDDAEDGIMLSFSDTGPGIPEEDAPHVFDPFFTTKSTGTGLGLAVSHSIITEHNATITLKAIEPTGTCFDVIFPMENDIEESI